MLTVLIVDDIPENILVLADYLANDYRLKVASSGSDALELVDRAVPDLILLDAVMPGMDGYEVCDRLQRNPNTQEIPVIFVTARNDPDSESRALAAGAVDFISKPVNRDVLRARVSTHIRLKQHTDQWHDLATHDPLTELANRRAFSERLAAEWSRAKRRETPLAILMIDIDCFKAYNDRYGHPQGDECLRRIASAIAGAVGRSGELAARYGGEEFVVLLTETPLEQAMDTARRIRERVLALNIPHADSDIQACVTVSIGIAGACPRHGQVAQHKRSIGGEWFYTPAITPEDLVEAADQALYTAKQAGRNRASVSSPLDTNGANSISN